MTDIAEERGVKIDAARLAERLQIPVIQVQANKRRGSAELKTALHAAVQQPAPARTSPFPPAFIAEVDRLEQELNSGTVAAAETLNGHGRIPRYLAERMLLDAGGHL